MSVQCNGASLVLHVHRATNLPEVSMAVESSSLAGTGLYPSRVLPQLQGVTSNNEYGCGGVVLSNNMVACIKSWWQILQMYPGSNELVWII